MGPDYHTFSVQTSLYNLQSTCTPRWPPCTAWDIVAWCCKCKHSIVHQEWNTLRQERMMTSSFCDNCGIQGTQERCFETTHAGLIICMPSNKSITH